MARQAARDQERAARILDADPAEAAIWQRIAASYEEAAWIMQVSQLPNGRPMLQQFDVDLELWTLAINAIQEFQARRGRANTPIWLADTQQGGDASAQSAE
ncbi:hypothetical protein [Pseudomonas sp.]|uniref:hypothetical protein n=1 Tax=Pseudomonas sp. TaxID=306 RepID=UPI003D1408ED